MDDELWGEFWDEDEDEDTTERQALLEVAALMRAKAARLPRESDVAEILETVAERCLAMLSCLSPEEST
jgi:hypothetical protein